MIDLKTRRRVPQAPLSAMSDIGFLLLVFIMLLSLINYRTEEKIDYPEAHNVDRTESDHDLEIWIDRQGRVVVDGKNLDASDLERLIVTAYQEEPSTRIHLLADRNTPYRNVDGVLSILQLLQHRAVSFEVKGSFQ